MVGAWTTSSPIRVIGRSRSPIRRSVRPSTISPRRSQSRSDATGRNRPTSPSADTRPSGIELSIPADLDVTTCDEGVYREFLGPGKSLSLPEDVDPAKPHMAGRTDVLYVLDIGGTRWLMRTWRHPESSAEDVAEMEAMLASIVIEAPAPSPTASASPGPQA